MTVLVAKFEDFQIIVKDFYGASTFGNEWTLKATSDLSAPAN
jgi:hypothetical protein